jgi:hypothetical protein
MMARKASLVKLGDSSSPDEQVQRYGNLFSSRVPADGVAETKTNESSVCFLDFSLLQATGGKRVAHSNLLAATHMSRGIMLPHRQRDALEYMATELRVKTYSQELLVRSREVFRFNLARNVYMKGP